MLKLKFFQKTKGKEYVVEKFLANLPPLESRVKSLLIFNLKNKKNNSW